MKKTRYSAFNLAHYAASAAAFLGAQQLGAAVVYTDLDPDMTIAGEGAEFALDLNGDGEDDFNFSIYSFSGTGTYYGFTFTYGVKIAFANALNGNEFVGSIVTYGGYSAVYSPPLSGGENIPGENDFAEGNASLALHVDVSLLGFPYYTYEQGAWLDVSEKFMGVRLVVDKDYFYGWIRLSVADNAGSITIHDYAYESNANQSIFTGQTATGIEASLLASTNAYAFGNQLTIEIPEGLEVASAILIDMSGRTAADLTLTGGTNRIDCSQFPTANYLVRILTDHGVYNKQVHLAN